MKRIIILLFIFSHFTTYIFSQAEKVTGKTNVITTPATITYKRTPKPDTTITKANQQQGVSSKTQPPVLPDKKQSQSSFSDIKIEKLDTIFKLGGKRIVCTVQKIAMTSIIYVLPSQTNQLEIPRKDVEKIIYRNGRKELINKPIFSMVDKTQWESVVVTEKEEDVEGLYKKDFLKANASSGSRSPKAAKQSAIIRLQKKAANIGALMVLITNSEMKGGYGEIPGWELEGIAYTDTPPADTASVNKAIRKMIERSRAKAAGEKKKKE